jgi:hypothetical protein
MALLWQAAVIVCGDRADGRNEVARSRYRAASWNVLGAGGIMSKNSSA